MQHLHGMADHEGIARQHTLWVKDTDKLWMWARSSCMQCQGPTWQEAQGPQCGPQTSRARCNTLNFSYVAAHSRSSDARPFVTQILGDENRTHTPSPNRPPKWSIGENAGRNTPNRRCTTDQAQLLSFARPA